LVICPSFTVITAKEHALFLNLFAVSKSNATKSNIGLLSKSIYDAETCAKVVLEAAKLKGVNSLPDLLKITGVPLEPFIDDKNRSAQDALHKEPEPEQMSFF